MSLDDHPTVLKLRANAAAPVTPQLRARLIREELRDQALACSADDAGIVVIDHEELDPQRDEILRHYPWTKSLLSIILKMSREPLRETPRSVANLEFHNAGHKVSEVCAHLAAALEEMGCARGEPGDGVPDGDEPASWCHLDRLAQTGCDCGG